MHSLHTLHPLHNNLLGSNLRLAAVGTLRHGFPHAETASHLVNATPSRSVKHQDHARISAPPAQALVLQPDAQLPGCTSRFSPRERSKVLVNPVRSFMLIAFSAECIRGHRTSVAAATGSQRRCATLSCSCRLSSGAQSSLSWSRFRYMLATRPRFHPRRGQITIDDSRLPYVRQIGQSR